MFGALAIIANIVGKIGWKTKEEAERLNGKKNIDNATGTYFGAAGQSYDAVTNKKVFFSYDPRTDHRVIVDQKTGYIIRDIDAERIKIENEKKKEIGRSVIKIPYAKRKEDAPRGTKYMDPNTKKQYVIRKTNGSYYYFDVEEKKYWKPTDWQKYKDVMQYKKKISKQNRKKHHEQIIHNLNTIEYLRSCINIAYDIEYEPQGEYLDDSLTEEQFIMSKEWEDIFERDTSLYF